MSHVLKVGGNEVTDEKVTLNALQQDSRGPHVLTFDEAVTHYSGTFNEGQFVTLEYPAAGDFVFRGKIMEAVRQGLPGNERVRYTCYSHRGLARLVQVYRTDSDEVSLPFSDYPERIYNADELDSDSQYNKNPTGTPWTVGEIIKDLFDSHNTRLLSENGASGDGYVQSDLDALTIKPPKIVLQDLDFDSAISVVLSAMGPTWAAWVTSGGIWRFYDTQNSGTSTDVAIGTDAVFGNNLRRHLRGRATAIKIVGELGRGENPVPAQVGVGVDPAGHTLGAYGTEILKCWDESLEDTWTKDRGAGYDDTFISSNVDFNTRVVTKSGRAWTPGIWADGIAIFPAYSHRERFTIQNNTADTVTLESIPSGLNPNTPVILRSVQGEYSDVFRLFQIGDPALRELVTESQGDKDCCPHVVGFIYNDQGIRVSTQQVSIRLEGDGKFRTEGPLARDEGGLFNAWADWKVVFCYRGQDEDPPFVRFPSSGFSGGASEAPFFVRRQKVVVASEFEDQVDVQDFLAVATELHKATSVVGLSGDLRIDGIRTDLYLDTRQNLNVSASGVTGWEDLGANLTAVNFDFRQNSTTLQLSTTGDTEDFNYGPILERLRAERERASAATEARKVGAFFNCAETSKGRTGTTGFGDGGTGGNGDVVERGDDLPSPLYRPGKTGPIGSSAGGLADNDRCESPANPCDQKLLDAKNRGQMICTPDGQRALQLKHPGDGSTYCAFSQLAGVAASDPNEQKTPTGIYFPFACVDGTLGDSPTDIIQGDCFEWRRIVEVVPTDVNYDPDTGTAVSPAQYSIIQAASADAYMQYNEDAHLCLSNKISQMHADIWGNANGFLTTCEDTIFDILSQHRTTLENLKNCVEAIFYCPGPKSQKCGPVPDEPDKCGPCKND